jgi:hypothetical protein
MTKPGGTLKLSETTLQDLKRCWNTEEEFKALLWGILARFSERVPLHPEIGNYRISWGALRVLGRTCSAMKYSEDVDAVAAAVGLIKISKRARRAPSKDEEDA